MFEILSDDDIKKAEDDAFEVWRHTLECEKALNHEYQWYLLRDRTESRAVAKAQRDDTLRQFIEWLGENTYDYLGLTVLIGGSIQHLKDQLEEKK